MDLIKLEPGAQSLTPTHRDDEWVYVLEGSMNDEKGQNIQLLLEKKDA